MTARFHAAWILPIAAPPIRGGWLTVRQGRIVAVGGRDDVPAGTEDVERVDLGDVALLPGLVNAHTHLELSNLRGLVPPSATMPDWVQRLLARREAATSAAAAVRDAVAELIACGTAAVGDIGNTLTALEPLERSGLHGVFFRELIGFASTDPEGVVQAAVDALTAVPASGRIRRSLAPHAPYSVSPPLFRAIRRQLDGWPDAPVSLHLAETRDEVEFLSTGRGRWRALLDELGAWNPAWRPPGTTPAAWMQELGFLTPRTLAVHGVHHGPEDLARLAAARTTLVACPRSNAWTGAGDPPIAEFYRANVPVAFGTDSLASVPDLSVFSELAAARRLAPHVPASRLLESATRRGAEALGCTDLGTLQPGRLARIIAVSVPPSVVDVEEYLVGGVEAVDVRWLPGAAPSGNPSDAG